MLNAADYFRAAAMHDGAEPDPRLADAIEAIRAARRPDGTWLQERRHGAGVVRGRRAARRAVQVAHLLWHACARVVGRRDPYVDQMHESSDAIGPSFTSAW